MQQGAEEKPREGDLLLLPMLLLHKLSKSLEGPQADPQSCRRIQVPSLQLFSKAGLLAENPLFLQPLSHVYSVGEFKSFTKHKFD